MTNQTQQFHRAPFMRARYNCSDPTLYRWTRSGKIPKPRYINGQRVWSDDQVEEADNNLVSDEPSQSATKLSAA
jgi:predicted DNA-binding transcriptional regulator AlpA